MKFKLLLLWAAIATPVFAQIQGGGITQPGAAQRSLVSPPSVPCTVGLSPALVYNNAGTDSIYTAQGSPCAYALAPGGSTSTLNASGIGASGAATANTLNGPNNAVPVLSASGVGVDGTAAIYANASKTFLRDTISIKDYVNVAAAGYVPARLSTGIQNSASAVTVNNGSTTLTCTGCNFTLADQTNPIVIWVENTANTYTTTIQTYISSTQVTLAVAPTFSSTVAFMATGTDSSTQIAAWFTALISKNKCGYIPAGYYGAFTLTGLSSWATPCIIGDNNLQSMIFLGSSNSFVSGNEFWFASLFRDFGIFGGKDALVNKYTGQNNSPGTQIFRDLYFRDFASSGLSLNSSDFVGIEVMGSYFVGLNSDSTIDIAMAGPDKGTIAHNHFDLQQFGIKLGQGGQSMTILDNEFIQGHTNLGGLRASEWIMPNSTSPVAALTSWGNKHGAENYQQTDYRFLLADSVASSGGNLIGDTAPILSASTGFITNLVINDKFLGAGGTGGPIVYSYTPKFISNQIEGMIEGTAPNYAVQFDASALPGNDYTAIGNQYGRFVTNGFGPTGFKVSNVCGTGQTLDPNGQVGTEDPCVLTPFMSGAGAVTLLTINPTGGFGIVGGGTRTPVADPWGGTTAATFVSTVSGTGNQLYASLGSNPVTGLTYWDDVWIKNSASGTQMSCIQAQIADGFSSPLAMNYTLHPTAVWQRYPLPFILRTSFAHTPPNVQFQTCTTGASGQTIDVAVDVYQATQPVSGGTILHPLSMTSGVGAPTIAVGAAAGTSPGTPTVTGTNTAGVITVITGTATTTAATLATITFNAGPIISVFHGCTLFPRNSVSAAAQTTVLTTQPTGTVWTIGSGATALTASTTYSWSYSCN